MGYEILSHTADEKFRAEGETLAEAFENTTKAFSEIVKGDSGSVKHSIEVEAESQEALLFDFLDRLIFLQETEGVAVSHAENVEITDKTDSHFLQADIFVDPESS